MATPVFHSGFYGSGAVGTTELAVTKWDVNPTAKLVEFENSMSGVYVVREATFKDVSGSVEVDFDFANNPFQSPPLLQPGTTITNLVLYLHQTAKSAKDGPSWAFASIIIDSTPQSLTVDGKITTRFSFKGAGGTVTFPTP